MDKGWVKLNRMICDNKLWFLEPFTKAQAWVDLFLNANHKNNTISIRGNLVVVKRGQLAWSEITMSKRWQWSRGKVRRFLGMLKTEQQIVQQKDRYITSITTILNYENYQNGTADGQQKDSRRYINKNDKNDKNDNITSLSDKSDEKDIELSNLLYEKILNNNPDHKKPNIESWAKHISLMRRIDNRTIEQIEYLINWSQADSFWQSNILSTKKLREKFDQLVIKIKSNKNGSGGIPVI